MKKLISIILFLGLAGAVGAAQGRSYSEKTAQNVVYESKVQRNVEYFCDTLLRGRAFGTPEAFLAAYDISNRFKKFGFLPLKIERGSATVVPSEAASTIVPTSANLVASASHSMYIQNFRASADSVHVGHNVIAMMPGSMKKELNSYIIVASHFDGIGIIDGRYYPGADSDVSGLVAMLSLAEMFSTMKTIGKMYYANIIFVAFDGKRMSMAGSNAFYAALERGEIRDPLSGKVISKSMIKAMINIDQIGATLEPLNRGREDYIIALGNSSLPTYRRDALGACNRTYQLNMDIGYNYYGSENFTRLFYSLSDQNVFATHGVPAVYFTSGITRTTNKPTDTPASLNYEVLVKRIYLMYYLINRLTF